MVCTAEEKIIIKIEKGAEIGLTRLNSSNDEFILAASCVCNNHNFVTRKTHAHLLVLTEEMSKKGDLN